MTYKTIEITDLNKAAEYLPYYKEQEKQSCSDFVRHYFGDSRYCVVYSCDEGMSLLLQWINDNPDTETRWQLARCFIETLVNRRIDFETAMSLEVVVTADNKVGFVYELPVIGTSKQKAFSRIAKIIETILYDVKLSWLSELRQGCFANFPESLQKMPSKLPEIPKTLEMSEVSVSETVEREGYRSVGKFYVKKKPVVAAIAVVSVIVILVFTVVIPTYEQVVLLAEENERLLSSEIGQLSSENEELLIKVERLLSEIEQLMHDKSQLESEYETLAAENQKLLNDDELTGNLVKENEELTLAVEELQKEIKQLQEQIDELLEESTIDYTICIRCFEIVSREQEARDSQELQEEANG
jgi:chaperonin cofactor prefoldin